MAAKKTSSPKKSGTKKAAPKKAPANHADPLAGSFSKTQLEYSLRADRENLRTAPTAEASDEEEEDDRTRHVLVFQTELKPDAVLGALRAFADLARSTFPNLEIVARYGDAPWDIASSIPAKFIDADDSLDVELIYARRGKMRDAFEVYLSPHRIHRPKPRLEGLQLMFRTVAPPEVDDTASRAISWICAALTGSGVKYTRE